MHVDLLIPRSKDGLGNEQCKMFHEARPEDKKENIEPMPAMKEWARQRGLIA